VSAASVNAKALVKSFGHFTAVDSVSFDVYPREVVGLLGANGAGKTTTIRMLVGLLTPTRGAASLLGRAPDRVARSRLGYVPQGLGLYGQLTVAENLDFRAAAYGIEAAPLPDTLRAVEDRRVATISLGLQRQLAFLCAVQHGPDVLVLDEPTSGMGPLAAARLWDQIRVVAESGSGVLVSTHSMLEARQCDRLILMSEGIVVGDGSEADIVDGMHAVEVSTPRWREAFAALSAPGEIVTLDGRAVRILSRSVDDVRAVVAPIDGSAVISAVPATIDERMAVLATM